MILPFLLPKFSFRRRMAALQYFLKRHDVGRARSLAPDQNGIGTADSASQAVDAQTLSLGTS